MKDKMWNACRLAMQIDQGTGSLPPSYKENTSYKKSGFISDVYSYSGGLGNINAGIVGAISDGVMIAFRGTSSPLDWIQDIITVQVDFPSNQGKVHSGFYTAIKSIFDEIESNVQELLSKSTCSNPSLYITGHSKGGGDGNISRKII
jgi:triacylglycerol lipase